MCGIAGIWRTDGVAPVEADLRRMCAALRHRGPDDEGYAVDAHAGVGMVRLSIIDLAGGHQPITNEDDTLVLVCNGEIYNHEALRAELRARGHRFRTGTDVEVILHLYEEQGPDCFKRLNGMFAVALVDRKRDELVLARDAFGQKPLYVSQTDHELVFASEPKAIVERPGFKKALNPEALASYLAFRYVAGRASMFDGVRRLAPGTWERVNRAGVIEERRYFSMRFARPPDAGLLTRPADLWSTLRHGVARHLMSERPIAVFLSGGVDSGSLVACMAELGHAHIVTFTAGFEGFDDNETTRARFIADRFKTDHHEVMIGADEYWHTWDAAFATLDEPNGGTQIPAVWKLSEAARQHATVVLSGEGADELLAGYARLDRMAMRFGVLELLRHAPESVATALLRSPSAREAIHAGDSRYLERNPYPMARIFSESEIQEVQDPRVASAETGMGRLRAFYQQRFGERGLDLLQEGIMEWWLPDNLLALADRITMGRSIELRCPFLDAELVALCARLRPVERGGVPGLGPTPKAIFKRAAQRHIGRDYVRMKKLGFVNAAAMWMRGPLRTRCQAALFDANALARAMFPVTKLEAVWNAALHGDDGAAEKAWALVVLNRWAQRWT